MRYSIALSTALLAVGALAAPLEKRVLVIETDTTTTTTYVQATAHGAAATETVIGPNVVATQYAVQEAVAEPTTTQASTSTEIHHRFRWSSSQTTTSVVQQAAQTTSTSVVQQAVETPAPAPTTTEAAGNVLGWTSTYTYAWTSTLAQQAATTEAAQTTAKVAATTQAAATTSSAAAASTGTTSSYAQAILDAHNNYRALHGAGTLSWDDTMASYASGVSGKCVFEHSGGSYGENLAAGYDSDTAAIKAWYDEGSSYNYAAGLFSEATGHFTQVVWKAATKVGCATVSCNGEDGTPGKMLTCEYDTGNVIGEFITNVLPLVS